MTIRNERVFLIYAISKNNVMGKDNTIPWKSMADFSWFRSATTGHTVIMGRKTWESLPIKPLKNRNNIVVSRDPQYQPEAQISCQFELATSLTEAITMALANSGENKVFIIGGKDILEEASQYAKEAYVSYVEVEVSLSDTCIMAPSLPPHKVVGSMLLCEAEPFHPAVTVKTLRFNN